MTRELVNLAGPALASTISPESIVVLPTGSIEHHGPHLPLSTDLLMADALAHAVVEGAVAEGVDAWILPALAYTKSDEHHWAPGTIWLSWDTLMRTVLDIGESVANTPAKTLLFLNGHGGNVALLQVALREIRKRFGLRTFLLGASVLAGPTEKGFGIHGGHDETSVILHLRPELVDMARAANWVPEHLADFEHIRFNGGAVSFGWLSDDFGPDGVIGDATLATAEHGAEVFERSVSRGVAALLEVARFRHSPDGAL